MAGSFVADEGRGGFVEGLRPVGASGGGGRVCEQLVDGRENIRESGDRSGWAERPAFLSFSLARV